MTFIEPMINAGRREVGYERLDRGDKGSQGLGAVERTLLVTANGTEILTRRVMSRRDQARRQPSRRLQDSQAQLDQQFRQGAEVSALLRAARASLTRPSRSYSTPSPGQNAGSGQFALGAAGRGRLWPGSFTPLAISTF